MEKEWIKSFKEFDVYKPDIFAARKEKSSVKQKTKPISLPSGLALTSLTLELAAAKTSERATAEAEAAEAEAVETIAAEAEAAKKITKSGRPVKPPKRY